MNAHTITIENNNDYYFTLLLGFCERITDWEDRFDTPPALDLNFSIDALGLLRLNGIALCPACQIESPCSLMCDDELFLLVTNTGITIEIHIDWPFDEEPFISQISKREDIYVCH